MPRPRLNQFAEDLGISRGSAKKLMAKARGRSDGGSNIIDKYSPELKKRMQRFEDAERIFQEDTEIGTKMDKSKTKPKSKQKMFDDYYQKHGKVHPKDPRTKKDHPMNREGSPLVTKNEDIVEAKDGKFVRGMGKASMCPPREVKVK
jgi:hypothetical protein|tara:strand:+ start:1018 stop:1458 length:441 start_codon:yes stop_codon:yes gene_type:complete